MDFEQWVVYDPDSDGCPILYVTDSREDAERMAKILKRGTVKRLAEIE